MRCGGTPGAAGRSYLYFSGHTRYLFVEATRHCRNNRHLIRVLDRRREPFKLANLRPIDEDVDKAAYFASLIA